MKAKITEKGLLIPRELAERLGAEEVEITEEPGRLLISPVRDSGEGRTKPEDREDPILNLGRNPVRTRVRDGSANHDRYLYTRD
jgi:virulence-associated protein VagC